MTYRPPGSPGDPYDASPDEVPTDPDHGRDPRVSAWLTVEPLDELTRARLVHRAADGATGAADGATGAAAAPARWSAPARLAAAAAALVVVVVIGIGVVRSADDGSAPTASDAPRRAPLGADAPRDRRAAPEALTDADAPAPTAALADLGDLGDVSSAEALRAAVERRPASGESRPRPVDPCTLAVAQDLGSPVAAGTATVDGRPATVVVVARPADGAVAVAVLDDPCTAGPSVPLP